MKTSLNYLVLILKKDLVFYKVDDEKKKAVNKAQIKATAAIQKAKLKIFALIGL